MNTKTSLNSSLISGGIFLGCLLGTNLFPDVAIYGHSYLPRSFSNTLFFFPQMAFPYTNVVVRDGYSSSSVFSHTIAWLLSIIQWGLLALVFSILTKRLKISYKIVLALVVIVATTLFVPQLISMLGATVELDGP